MQTSIADASNGGVIMRPAYSDVLGLGRRLACEPPSTIVETTMNAFAEIKLLTTAGPVTLRRVTHQDERALAAMLLVTAAETPMVVTTLDEMHGRMGRIEEIIDSFENHPDRLWLVAAQGDAIVGELSLRGMRQRRLAHVATLGMSVAVGWRGFGIGRGMLQAALGWAGTNPRIRRVTLAVVAENSAAIGLYRSFGFREEGRRVGQVELEPGRFVDDCVMALDVQRFPQSGNKGF